MGFRKWLLKHGPGSVGATAKTMVLAYKTIKDRNPEVPPNELLRLALKSRMDALELCGQPVLTEQEQDELLKSADGDLSMLVMLAIKYERPGVFSPGITNRILAEIVIDVVNEYAPEAGQSIEQL